MKVLDSGMPEEEIWNGFFDTAQILSELQLDKQVMDVAEVGSGYGTFTIPVAKAISGKIFAFDIETEMIESLKQKIRHENITNIKADKRDVLLQSTGLRDNSVDYVMFFNILHNDAPSVFFDEAYRILKPNGKVGIIHWRSDIYTPRGPELSIRPRPEQVVNWIDHDRFGVIRTPFFLEPYHYGLILLKR